MNIALRSVEELLNARRAPRKSPAGQVSKEVTSALWDRICEAAQVLRRMPDRERVFLTSGDRVAWPTIILGYWEAYGQHRARYRPPVPSGAQIDDMEMVFTWLTWLSKPASYGGLGDIAMMNCVFACCGQNLAPSQAAGILGLHRNTVRRYRDEGLRLMACKFVINNKAA